MRSGYLSGIPNIAPQLIDKRTWLVDVPLKPIGIINGKRNLLIYNFYAILHSILTGRSGGYTVYAFVDGSAHTYACRGTYGGSALRLWTTAKSVAFSKVNYGLADAQTEFGTSTVTIDELSDRVRVNISAVLPITGNSVILIIRFGTSSNYYAPAIAGKDIAFSVDQTITWRLNFFEPLVRNLAYIFFGLLSDTDPTGILDLAGTSHDVRTSAEGTSFATGVCKVHFGTSNAPFSFDNYAITDPIEVTPKVTAIVDDGLKYILTILTSYVVPASDTDIYEIGIVRTLYDTAGNTYDALLARIVLSTPITLHGGKTNVVILRLLAKE